MCAPLMLMVKLLFLEAYDSTQPMAALMGRMPRADKKDRESG
jgi:hypothetical protein